MDQPELGGPAQPFAFAAPVGEALLSQFISFAQAAVAQGDLDTDPAYEKVLRGLQVAAHQAGAAILEQLQLWRNSLLIDLSRERIDLLAQRKRLVVETLFLEGTVQLVATTGGAVLGPRQGQELEHVVFEWILKGETDYANDPYPQLHATRNRVVTAAAELLGCLSHTRLPSITAAFLAEVGARIRSSEESQARRELVSLCNGMRYVRLAAGTPEQLRSSTDFLERVHPLKHVAPDKKSRLQHVMCTMLTNILQPLVDEGDPSLFGEYCDAGSRKQWFITVAVLRSDLYKWASKQSKHVGHAFPAIAALTCLEEHVQLPQAMDAFVELLHRQLKDKKAASMAMLCLARCVSCYLRRMGERQDGVHLTKWVARSVGPVVQGMVRGALLGPEQQELTRGLVAIVAQHLPEYAISDMMLELLQVSGDGANWEAPMAGLKALMSLLVAVPGRLAGMAPPVDLPATALGLEQTSSWVTPKEASRELLELVKQRYQPLDAYGAGHLAPHLTAALSRILQQCHQLYGFSRMTSNAARSAADGSGRERLSALPVFVEALGCVPFLMPDHWADDSRICDDLPSYTIHLEQPMRQISTKVLHRCMHALPALRDPILGGVAMFVARLPEEYVEVVRESLGLLMSLLREWLDLAAGDARAAALAGSARSPGAKAFGSLHRVEGAALALLCASDVEVRRLALEALRGARQLSLALAAPLPPPAAGPGSRRSTMATQSRRASLQHSALAEGSARLGVDQIPSGTLADPSQPPFVADVIDHTSGGILQRSYWDFGRWSDLFRVWRPLPEGATFEGCMMQARTHEDQVRWARIVCELMKEVWRRCESTAWMAHIEIAAKLQALLSLDSNGRQVLPHDQKVDMARAYCLAVAAAPLVDSTQMGDKGLTTREFARLMVTSARSGIDALQQLAVLGLGNVHPSCQPTAAQEVAALAEDHGGGDQRQTSQRMMTLPSVPGMGRSRGRHGDTRLTQAHIYRSIAGNLVPGALIKNPVLRDRLMEFVVETAKHITSTVDVSPELQQLRYCLATVARHCGSQLGDALPQAFPPTTRAALYDMFSLCCEEGQAPGQYRTDLRRSIATARGRVRDAELSRALESDLVDASEVLEHAAYLGMAAMLLGPVFSADVRNPAGRVFGWIDRMLSSRHAAGAHQGSSRATAWGPQRDVVARTALRNLLQSNPDLASVFVDRSYSSAATVASGYFQVLTEVYSALPLPLPAHAVVALVLHKLVDTGLEMREAARGLLGVLTRRAWGRETRYHADPAVARASANGEGQDAAVVLGTLVDSHVAYQMHLSARLALEHPELAEDLVMQMLSRQLDNESGLEAMLCLCPWFEHVTLGPEWQGQWAERVLDLLYSITANHGARQAYQVQKLWATLAANRRNVVPILDFVIAKCAEDLREAARGAPPCSVGKQIALYLARVAPRQTVDYLAYEVALQLEETDRPASSAPDAGGSAQGPPQILEFHHLQRPGKTSSQASLRDSTASMPASGAPTPRAETALRRGAMDLLLNTQSSAWSDASSGGGGHGPSRGGGGDAHSVGSAAARVVERVSMEVQSFRELGLEGRPLREPSRPELALCVLSELAYEHDEDFRVHLPLLLHVVALNADSGNAIVRLESCQLLIYLLHSLACRHLAAQANGTSSPEYLKASGLITRLQTLHGQPLWPREQPSLAVPQVGSGASVAVFAQTVVECFYFDTDLRERWCAEALKWACGARCRHFASRSHQLFCALHPALSSASCTAMLAALLKCLHNDDGQSLDTAAEILCTLRALLMNLEPSKVLLYPQLLMASMVLLTSSVVRIGELTMHILLLLLDDTDLSDLTVQNTLLSVLPLPDDPQSADENARPSNGNEQRSGALDLPDSVWALGQGLFSGVAEVDDEAMGQWIAVQQLAVKGLFQPETELLALEVFAAIAKQLASGAARSLERSSAGLFSTLSLAEGLSTGKGASPKGRGLEVLLGSSEAGLAISLGAAIPWLCAHLQSDHAADVILDFLEASSSACDVVGWQALSDALVNLCSYVGMDTDPATWLPPVCQALCEEAFPTYARLVFQRVLEVLRRGAVDHQVAALAVLKALFEVPGADLGSSSWLAEESPLMQLLSAMVDGPLASQALELCQAMLCYRGSDSGDLDAGEAQAEWPLCMDDLGECNKLCSGALLRVVSACPGSAQLLGR